MKKSKLFKATIIALALLFAVTGVAYADNDTSKFTDIDGHWAEQHINSVYSKGLMGGATETLFKPGDLVKNYDALVSISRMLGSGNDINMEQLVAKYQEKVIEKFKVPEYARDHVLVCLEKGIISDFDVSAYATVPYATKKDIAKYLGIALGAKVKDGAPPAVLPFKDSMYVPTIYKPYIKYLIDAGIINGTGDANGNFNPNANIDRASFAKMLDVASDVYNNITPGQGAAAPDDGNQGTGLPAGSTDTGTDTNTDTNTGSGTSFDPGEGGLQVDVTAVVDQVIPEYGNLAVFVGTERKNYKVAENVVCTIDDVASDFWKLKKSDTVKLYLENDKITKIVGESKIRKMVGTLTDIKSGDKITLTMETTGGDARNYTITAKTIVIKDGKTALWQELKKGNSLVLTTSYDELIEINADGVKSSDKGVIESVVYSRIAPPKLVITTPDGSQNTYYADKEIEISGADNDVYSLRPGMQVEASLLDDEIRKISVLGESTRVHAEVKGIIKSIDGGSGILVMEVYDSNAGQYTDKKVFIGGETKIAYVDLASLEIKTLDLDDLKVSQTISVVGSGSAEGIFATTIQLIN
ncbi:MAG TPA: S-layer homology domain-containing protein [Clostridia bacterium]|nr:S-layer homology domain-containing protein [Clostridia bacterium]